MAGEVLYEQDFEALDQASLTALGDAGFLGFGTELDADGSVANAYGAFPHEQSSGGGFLARRRGRRRP